MHELGAVGALIDAVVVGIAEHGPCRVDALRVRRGSAFSEEVLLQAFTMLSRGTPLEGARLDVEVVNHIVACPCGLERAIVAEELIGHVWVCPNCGHVEEVEEQDDLALIDATLTPAGATLGTGGR
jgi:Zn finger protein HypA/HybF involved in hydrogenase expression